MTFSKFAHKIHFYLIVAILYLIQNKLKIFIRSFILCRLLCPNEWFQVEFLWRNIIFVLAIVLRCWNSVEYIQKMIIFFLTFRLMKWFMELALWKCAKSRPSHLQVFCKIDILKNFAKLTEAHLCQSLIFKKVASELWQNFMSNFVIELLRKNERVCACASKNERLCAY